MTVEDDVKMDILDDLTESFKRASSIEMRLMIQRRQTEANEFGKAAKKLSKEIDVVMAGLINEWAEQSASINLDIRELNDKLADAINALKKDIESTEQIVEAIGYVDSLTFIARRLLKPSL